MTDEQTMSMGQARPEGVIHDLGYRRYDGPRLGRGAIVRALYWQSLRSAFGIGRGAKAKIVPFVVAGVMLLPAVVNAVSVARGGPRLVGYDTYVPHFRALVMLVFVAVQAPEMVSRDLRSHVLPLYMSRPMRRLDYPLAKYAAFASACLVVVELPLVVLYLGTIVSASGGSVVWANTRALLPGLGVGLLWAVLLAAIGVVLASLATRRAYATGLIAIYLFLTWVLSTILINVSSQGFTAASAGNTARLSGLVSPFMVLDGVRQWLGGTPSGPAPPPGAMGAVYGLMFVALLAVSLAGLAARYQKVGAS